MTRRPEAGRGLFYTRDSGGKHERTPGEYVRWAQREAGSNGITFNGTPEQIEAMIRDDRYHQGDLFLDYGVTGNRLSRPGLNALMKEAAEDPEVSHIFIPRRDRLARPDDPIDAMKLEHTLSGMGLTLCFMDRVVPPSPKGRRRDLSELIASMLEYNSAGEYRREVAQKILHAQISLARAGYSGGGHPPYGFRRCLVRADGTRVRDLELGEKVRMPGHHVMWLPGPEEELSVVRRILEMLETVPASRVAAILTSEEIPTPTSCRRRGEPGGNSPGGGTWHQTTIKNIARHPLLRAVATYGRRSLGDQLRFAPDGPRPLADSDFRDDGQPRVVVNPESALIVSPARFDPIIDPERHERLLAELDRRGGSQRGKPRSRTPEKNPLGARIFDMCCGWPMYREPYRGSFRYVCGLYHQSRGGRCRHNQVDGMIASRFLLGCVRQRVLTPGFRQKLEERLRAIAASQQPDNNQEQQIKSKRSALAQVKHQQELAARNMALAETPEQRRATAEVFDQLQRELKSLEQELREAQAADSDHPIPEDAVAAAMAEFDRLAELANDEAHLGALGQLFQRLNARLFLRFQEVQAKKRKLNKVAGGVVTFGHSPPPVSLYAGPTSRRALEGRSGPDGPPSTPASTSAVPCVTDREGESLGIVHRGGRG